MRVPTVSFVDRNQANNNYFLIIVLISLIVLNISGVVVTSLLKPSGDNFVYSMMNHRFVQVLTIANSVLLIGVMFRVYQMSNSPGYRRR